MNGRRWAGWLGLLAFAIGSVAIPGPFAVARETMRERIRDRLAERMGGDKAPKVPGSETIAYGRDPLQSLDIWRAKGAGGAVPTGPPAARAPGGGEAGSREEMDGGGGSAAPAAAAAAERRGKQRRSKASRRPDTSLPAVSASAAVEGAPGRT